MDLSDYLTLSEAAKALGYASPSSLSLYVNQGRISGAQRIGRTWLIPKVWLDSELKNPSLAPQGGRGSSRKSGK